MSGDRKRKEPGGTAQAKGGAGANGSSSSSQRAASSAASTASDSSPEPPSFASPSQTGVGGSQPSASASSRPATTTAIGRRASLRSSLQGEQHGAGDDATVTSVSSSATGGGGGGGSKGASKRTRSAAAAVAATAATAAAAAEEDEELTQTQSQPILPPRGPAANGGSSSNKKRARRASGGGGGAAAMEEAGGDDEDEAEAEREAQRAGNRRDAMRRVAESRAAFFARADENDRAIPAASQSAAAASAGGGGGGKKGRSVPSSTPLLPGGAAGAAAASPKADEKEEWNGPFSIARRMLKQRAAAKAAREERLEGGQVLAAGEEGEEERVKVEWTPQPRTGKKKGAVVHQPPSLAEACLRLLLQHVDAIEALGGVSTQVRYQFAEALARDGRLTAEAVMALVEPGMAELYLPDCKHVSEAALVSALERAASAPDEDDEDDCPPPPPQPKEESTLTQHSPALKVLRLRWCGQAFGKKAIEAFARLGLGKGVEALELTGLYRLKDEDLIEMIAACPALRSLEMPYKSHVSPRLLSSLVSTAAAKGALTSLNLAYCADLPHDALAALRGLENMRELDLRGLDKLTDGIVGEIVARNGATLQALRLRGCRGLTNEAVMHVGNGCRRLTVLDLGELHQVSHDALQALLSTPECARGLEEAHLARSNVDDDAILALAMTAGLSLRRLDVNGGGALTDAAVVALVKFCRSSLQDVDLSFCRKVSDDALGHLADSCPRLRRLALWGCTQVTDRFLRGHRRQETLEVVGRAGSGSRVSLHKGLASASTTGGV